MAIIALAVIGEANARELATSVVRVLPRVQAGIVTGALAAITFLAIGAIGVFILDLFVSSLGSILRPLAQRTMVRSLTNRLGVSDAFRSVEELVLELYRQHSQQLLDFFRLRSRATPEHGNDTSSIDELFDAVRDHFGNQIEPSILVALSYYSAVSQDQAKIEAWTFEVRDIYYFLLLLTSLCILALRWHFSADIVLLLLVALVVGCAFSIPLIQDRKRRLASLLLAGYCDNFTVAEGASVEDRAGSW